MVSTCGARPTSLGPVGQIATPQRPSYTRPMTRRIVLVMIAAAIIAACAGLDPRPRGMVILYGRNAAPGDVWFGLLPAGDPPETVGFGSDIGVACLDGPSGTEVFAFDGDPSRGGQPGRAIGRVPGTAEPLVAWVDVAGDGSLTTGNGVPPWWSDDPQAC